MSSFKVAGRAVGYVMMLGVSAVFLGSCDLAKNQLTYDRSAELDRQDYRDALAPVAPPAEEEAAIPDFEPIVATPEELRLPSPLVTVSVNNTVSLRDLMFELAEQAEVDLELDPQIRGSIIFTAKDRPFDEVVRRISEMAGLRYKFENHVLRVELDRPYLKNYNIDYINVVRTSSSQMKAEIQLGSSSGSDGSPTSSGGSTADINSQYDTDIWAEIEANIEQILTSSDTYVSLATMADPVATPVSVMPPALPTDPNNPNSVPPPLPGSPQVSQMAPGVAPTLSVSSVAGEPLVPSAPATYSLSRQSGIISIFASERQHRAVQKFLDDFRKRTTSQVLIEAKVLQVDLSDEYSTGINWDEIKIGGDFRFDASFDAIPLVPAPSGGFTAILNTDGGDIAAVATAVSRFGTVRALSSPRVTVLNNQPALVNVAQNNVFFNFDVQTNEDSDTNNNRVNIDSEQRSTPEGVILTVVPNANPDTGEILLSVRPTISRITSNVEDPTIAFSLAALGLDPATAPTNAIPEVAVQEMDSVLKLQSGQIAIMGGLMRDANNVQNVSLPVLGDLPYLGNLFKSHTDIVEKSELVVLIRARLITGDNIHDTDRKIYNKFSGDRRPARL